MPPPRDLEIDLDRPPSSAASGAAGGAGVADHRWRRSSRGLAPALLSLLLLAAAAGPEDPALASAVVVDFPGDSPGSFHVVADTVLVADPNVGVAAYDPRTGQRRWETNARVDLVPVAQDQVLVDRAAAFGLDPLTGEVRWSHPGLQVRPGDDFGLLLGDIRGDLGQSGEARGHRVTAIDLATGEPVWEQPLPGGGNAWLVGEPPQVVIATDDGELQLRDPATGALRLSRSDPSVTEPDLAPPVAVAGHLIRTHRDRDCEAADGEHCRTVRSYRLDTLEPVWEHPVPTMHSIGLHPCGPMLCVPTLVPPPGVDDVAEDPAAAARVLAAVDPATGEQQWSTQVSRWSAAEGGLVLRDPVADQELLLDPGTGESVHELTGWRWASTVLDSDRYLVLLPLGLPPQQRPADDPRPPVMILDLVTAELAEHPWVPGLPRYCRGFPDGLACTYNDRLAVWTW